MAQGRRARLVTAVSRIARVFLGAFTAGVVLAPAAAFAGEGSATEGARLPTVRLDYHAPTSSSCPSRADFIDGVRRYTRKWTLVDDDATREFVVALDRRDQVFRGTLEITVGGHKTEKDVTGPSCAAVARGLAVMVALVIDSGASRSEQTETSAVIVPASEAPGSLPVTPPLDTPPLEQSGNARPNPRAKRESLPRARESKSSPRWTFDARLETSSAVTSRALTVIGAFVDLQLPLFGTPDAANPLGPSSVAIGVRQSVPSTIGVRGGSTDFLWSAATVRACPLRLRVRVFGDRLDVAPCVESNLGALQVETKGIPVAQQTTTYWVDAALAALGVWHLPGPWVVTAEFSLVAPFTRRRFEVVELASLSPGTVPRSELVSQAPNLGISAGLGLGFEL